MEQQAGGQAIVLLHLADFLVLLRLEIEGYKLHCSTTRENACSLTVASGVKRPRNGARVAGALSQLAAASLFISNSTPLLPSQQALTKQ